MKNISESKFLIGIAFFSLSTLLQSCSKQEYFNIPKNADGSAFITSKVASTTNTGITTFDNEFSVTATLPNAKVGDTMMVELLANQIPAGGTTTRLLPITGTQKKLVVDTSFKMTVTYTRQQALLVKVGDLVTVTFAGKTESAFSSLTLGKATTLKGPLYNGNAVTLRRNSGAAYFDVAVAPKKAAYTGSIIVLKKNGINLSWSSSSFAYGTRIPISGDEFAIGKDTMYYAFVTSTNDYADTLTQTVFANLPLLQLTKSGTMVLGSSTGGVNILDNSTVAAASSANASIGITNASLKIAASNSWAAVSGNSISFVPSTSALYTAGNAVDIQASYDAGTSTATIDPIAGVPFYIFKMVTGGNTYYGILRITSVVPGTSVAYEYKIGSTYAQLAILK
jgi:hypothetical protein